MRGYQLIFILLTTEINHRYPVGSQLALRRGKRVSLLKLDRVVEDLLQNA